MKKFVYILVVSFFFTASCSTRKNTFVNRNYHKMTAKYNVLYNGNLALEKGIKELANKYEDNFREVLPIEPLQIDEEETFISLGESEGEISKSSFEIAEEKAVKAVQKHSMNINGDEQNNQIDNAYLLLGKARYYSQRFVPALEAFDFLLKNFYIEDKTHNLRIWKAKTQIRLQNEDRAIKTLKNLLSYSYKEIGEETREKAHTTLAMAYMAIDSVSLTIEQLSKATETKYNNNQYARNLIVLGQLYRQENNLDSSQVAFQKVIDYTKSPYRYKIHSYIEQAKNITDSTNYKILQEQFTQLIKEYENKEYLDELYYQAALMNFRDGDEKLALVNLTNSVHTPLAKNFQKGVSYEKAGDYYFDKAQFINAGAYYDSVLATVKNDNTKRIRKLRRKRISLEEIIDYETVLKHNDSILTLVAMNESERRAYFEEYITKLKKVDKIAAIVKENEERAKNATTGFGNNTKFGDGINGTENTGKWYFYNAQAVGFGKSTFQKVWGNRKLQDNWRLSKESKKDDNNIPSINSLSDSDIVEQSKKYDIEYYLNSIPSDEKEIQKMHNENSNALYQLGLIYKEKFQEYSLATQRLERFLAEDPKAKFILPARYHLYKIYEITGNPKLEIIKQKILTDYPDSRFAKIIQNPEELINPDSKKTPEIHYEKVYCDYEYEKYTSVLGQCETAIKQYTNDPIQAKFELLKSYAIYKLQGKEPFMTNLEYVVANFPKTEESEHAQEILDLLNGVKKTAKQERKNENARPGEGKEKGKIKRPAQNSSNNRTKKTGNNKESSKRQSRKTNNQEGRNNNPSSRPPEGSNNKPPGNNNQNSNELKG